MEIVTSEKLEELVSSGGSPILFLHKVGPQNLNSEGWTFKMIFDTEGTLYYYDKHNIKPNRPNAFLASDFKRISR